MSSASRSFMALFTVQIRGQGPGTKPCVRRCRSRLRIVVAVRGGAVRCATDCAPEGVESIGSVLRTEPAAIGKFLTQKSCGPAQQAVSTRLTAPEHVWQRDCPTPSADASHPG